jgi:hypothetical protein
MAFDTSKKLFHIRVGFGWMRPKEEDPTLHSFRAGIKYFLLSPRGPLSPGVKSSSSASSASDSTGMWAAALPTILVPRKRPVILEEEETGADSLAAALPLATPPAGRTRSAAVLPPSTPLKLQHDSRSAFFPRAAALRYCPCHSDTYFLHTPPAIVITHIPRANMYVPSDQ